MRKLVFPAIAMVAALLSAAAVHAENRHVDADSLYVRANPRGFFVGTLFRNAGFFRQQTSNDYAYGYAGGNFQGCGWVETTWTDVGGNTPPGCAAAGFSGSGAASRQFLLANYASAVNDYLPGKNLPLLNGGSFVRVKPGETAGLYGNYRGGSHKNFYVNIDSSTPLSWRWISDDGRSVAVNYYPGDEARSGWAFIRRSALPDKLTYSDGVAR